MVPVVYGKKLVLTYSPAGLAWIIPQVRRIWWNTKTGYEYAYVYTAVCEFFSLQSSGSDIRYECLYTCMSYRCFSPKPTRRAVPGRLERALSQTVISVPSHCCLLHVHPITLTPGKKWPCTRIISYWYVLILLPVTVIITITIIERCSCRGDKNCDTDNTCNTFTSPNAAKIEMSKRNTDYDWRYQNAKYQKYEIIMIKYQVQVPRILVYLVSGNRYMYHISIYDIIEYS